ncbi:endonuclease/exonuclease/phosphatase family protein [Flexithrix dorotheae]|uniref:endonuclease/exonuclease/phosphatase family protein n=1 Tax=Flexithrix dorotheae TaxID=70993 RepID=UPI00036BB26B|nr:endonuclease/exonuclease/phosphatase family protein [Flexithrix dorotheae]
MKVFVYLLFFLVNLIVLVSPIIAPKDFWFAGVIVQLIPLFFVINSFLVLIFLIKGKKRILFPFLFVIPSFIFFFGATYQFPSNNIPEIQNTTSIVSYNTSFFNKKTTFSEEYYDPLSNTDAIEINDWLKSNNADIICLQEFFDDVNSSILNNVASISEAGGYYHNFVYKQKHDNGIREGLIIFSKYPIIEKGTVFLSENHYNGAIYADLKINSDTVRIINAHLESMRLGSKANYLTGLIKAYKRGVVKHNLQLEQLLSFIKNTPYKMILCGDLNETPYSFVYNKLGNDLYNAFENGGSGFGFSYNSSILPFLRIDNQFYDTRIKLIRFDTKMDCKASKHFPIIGIYAL